MQNKPYIVCHMMATIDGKITSGTGVDILEDYFDLYTKTEDELKANSWMLGRITMEMFAKGEKTTLEAPSFAIATEDFIVEKSEYGYMVGIDVNGALRWNTNKIKLSNYPHELPIIIIVTEQTPQAYLNYLQVLKINYLFAGKDTVNFTEAMEKLTNNFGIQRLLLEGGGKINGSMMNENLVDEISLMITPLVLNRTQAPGIFERTTDIIETSVYSLSDVVRLPKDCVWLRYTRI